MLINVLQTEDFTFRGGPRAKPHSVCDKMHSSSLIKRCTEAQERQCAVLGVGSAECQRGRPDRDQCVASGAGEQAYVTCLISNVASYARRL